MIKKWIKNWLKKKLEGEVMNDYWELIDKHLKGKTHSRHLWYVNGRYYEVVRRYKARKNYD